MAPAILQLSFWLSIKFLPVTLIVMQSCCRMSHKPWFDTLSNVGLWPKTRWTQIIFLMLLDGIFLGIRSSFQIEWPENYKEIWNLFSAWKIKYRACLSWPYPFPFFKGCLPQILLDPFLNTLSHITLIDSLVIWIVIVVSFHQWKLLFTEFVVLWGKWVEGCVLTSLNLFCTWFEIKDFILRNIKKDKCIKIYSNRSY